MVRVALVPILVLALSGCLSPPIAENSNPLVQPVSTSIAPLQVDGFTAADDLFAQPYIDVQEWREEPVRHFYVHGGFTGTDTRFSYYLPPENEWEGRFFQHATPVPLNENLAQEMPAGKFNKIGFSVASGAYFVETNGGGELDIANGSPLADPTITAYRANAAAARFSRHVAQQFYGTDEHIYGYLHGGSGGAYRTIGSMENTSGVWDGAVPYVPGSTMAIPNMFTVRVQALRELWDVFPQIIDAVEPGGSGDPYAGLTDRQARVLREVENMGFPMQTWYGYQTMGIHGFAALYPGVKLADGTYFTDFWTQPGYLGHDHPEYFTNARLQHSAEVVEAITLAESVRLGINTDASSEQDVGGVDNAFEAVLGPEGERVVGYRLAQSPPPVRFIGGDVVIESGTNAGRTMPSARIVGDIVVLGFADDDLAVSVQPGDTIRVDNSDFLAMESYHRHQVPGPDFAVWDQYRDENGEPLYPQRPFLVGPLFTANTMGGPFRADFHGKMIILSSLWDREAMPWQGDWYRRQYEATGNDVRLYFTDHALHGDQPGEDDASRVVSYAGPLQQALRELAAWVEGGAEPPSNTQYAIENGQVILPETAAQRLGMQPTVSLTVGQGDRIEVGIGEPVDFSGLVSTPPDGGVLVSAEWDFDGDGQYTRRADLATAEGATSATVTATHAYSEAGTYFVSLRATAQPRDALGTPYAELINLDRVRVVVTD
ncbi:PKD domain-containing protein [Erythrobacter alti]|uniref:PKD domain-containing protein n=1 Tax=Erythrobacter alti TaxID=1896145 RepID=UPI0030F46BE3